MNEKKNKYFNRLLFVFFNKPLNLFLWRNEISIYFLSYLFRVNSINFL